MANRKTTSVGRRRPGAERKATVTLAKAAPGVKAELRSDFLTPVTRTTLTVDICRKMVTHLIRGHWREGEKIPAERELCLKLGVGRASLREALKALEIMGMIETRLGDGTYVCRRSDFFSKPLLWVIASGSDAQARELVEARTLIEVELAGLAAERATAANVKLLSEELDVMESMKDNPKGFVQADVNFHLLIGLAAANSILLNALHLIRNLLQEWILAAVGTAGVPEKACAQHRRLLLAIKSHDSAAARKAMQRHLHDMADYLPKRQAEAEV
ncbi:MAG TPA: FadR/GntR family transcriptional regulator [Acidobacteriaceae bacterium]|nr:FadR/GntR family transcriptional regulator [Acidobacteriaceae bacterium]